MIGVYIGWRSRWHAAEAASHGVDLVPIVALLGAAVLGVPLFKRLGLGSVLGDLAAGVLLGPSVVGLIDTPESVLTIAELGVVMFLFIIGLEMEPSTLWALREQIFGLGDAWLYGPFAGAPYAAAAAICVLGCQHTLCALL